MSQRQQPRNRGDFHIAIICALPLEATAVVHQFDAICGETGNMFGQAPGDPNAYTQGVIGPYNVVLAHPPSMGKGSAAGVAASIGSSFLGIELALVVGICGGVPIRRGGEEIRLGDVVISDGIIEYDFRKQYPDKFVRKNTVPDSLGRPNSKIRSLFNKLKEDWSARRLRTNTSQYLISIQQKSDRYRYPGLESDKLFLPTYRHKHHEILVCAICSKCKEKGDEVCQGALDSSCSDLKCNENNLVRRSRLSGTTQEPMIHYGLIASGDTVMKSGEERDAIAKGEGVIAFEMEAAGVWDKLPCIVIKGVCNYADSHKNKDWQNYAAATAASCMKAFLQEWIPSDKFWQSVAPTTEILQDRSAELTSQSIYSEENISGCLRSLSFSNIDDRQNGINLAYPETCNWLFEMLQFQKWQDRTDFLGHNGVLWIKGNPGAGKSTLMKHTLLYCQNNFKDHTIAAYFFNARGNVLEKTSLGMLRSLLYQLLD